MRIARELHDAVAHSIATINVQAGAAEHVIAEHPDQAAEALAVIRRTSRQALVELREILGVLHQDDDASALAPAVGLSQLDALLRSSHQAGVEVELQVVGESAPLPTSVDLAAYRIVQESLTNVARHTASHSAQVTLEYRDSALTVTITDQGSGDGGFADGAGRGIEGMRERADALGGTLRAGPRPGGGFEVSATLPLPPRAQA